MSNPFLAMVVLIGEGREDLVVRFAFSLHYLSGFSWPVTIGWG